MARPPKGNVRLVAYVPPDLKAALRVEALKRSMTLGELIAEAFAARMVKVRRDD